MALRRRRLRPQLPGTQRYGVLRRQSRTIEDISDIPHDFRINPPRTTLANVAEQPLSVQVIDTGDAVPTLSVTPPAPIAPIGSFGTTAEEAPVSFGERPSEQMALSLMGEQPAEIGSEYAGKAGFAAAVPAIAGYPEYSLAAAGKSVVPGPLSFLSTLNRKAGRAISLNRAARELQGFEGLDVGKVKDVAETVGTPEDVEALEKEIGVPMDLSLRETEALGVATRKRPQTFTGYLWQWMKGESDPYAGYNPTEQAAMRHTGKTGPELSVKDVARQVGLTPREFAGALLRGEDPVALGQQKQDVQEFGWDVGDIGANIKSPTPEPGGMYDVGPGMKHSGHGQYHAAEAGGELGGNYGSQSISSRSQAEVEAETRSMSTSGEPSSRGPAGGGEDTVLCTALYKMGKLPEEVYKADSEYAVKYISAQVYIGYSCWARHLAEHRWMVVLLSPLIRAWAYHMAYKMKRVEKRNRLGEILEIIGIPLCRLIWRVRNGLRSCERRRITPTSAGTVSTDTE